jgi:hypothetical protein
MSARHSARAVLFITFLAALLHHRHGDLICLDVSVKAEGQAQR